jgi:signal peptidase II
MQAAGGTALAHDDGMRARSGFVARPAIWTVFALVAGLLLAVDQVSKWLAVERLTDEPDVPVLGDFLQLHLTYNPGAAFSIGTEFTVAISGLALVASLVVLWMSRKLADVVWAVALGLVLAGILGNLTDRLLREPGPFRGHVVDFLMLPNWPIFNVADICINVGVGLVLIQVFRGIGLDGRRVSADDLADDASSGSSSDDGPDASGSEEGPRDDG